MMLTIFAVPKAFQGPMGVLQRNAVRSWKRAVPEGEVFLLGDDPGVAEAAAELQVKYIWEVDRNSRGTPLVSSVFAKAEAASAHNHLCYLNADILLFDDFAPALRRALAELPNALMTGRRYDLDLWKEVHEDAEFTVLKDLLAREGRIRAPMALDYFIFPKGSLRALPSFAVGRPSWDNWLIYHARCRRIPVLDLSAVVTVAHQTHDYSHLPQGEAEYRNGSESVQNQILTGGYSHFYNLRDATHRLEAGGIRPIRMHVHAYGIYRTLMHLAFRWSWMRPTVQSLKRGYKALFMVEG